jgi:hypothetical protein
MSHGTISRIALAATTPAVARPSRRTLKVFVTSLLFLLLTQLPAVADHVHQLTYDLGWVDTDLTVLAGGVEANGAMTAFYTTPNDQFHVFYVDTNPGDVHQLYYNGHSWTDQDLSALTGAPTDSGFITGVASGNLQYVFYPDSNGHVWELNYNNSTWVPTDLTAQYGAPLADWELGLLAFAQPGNQLYLYYSSEDLDLIQLYFNGSSWSSQDLSSTYFNGAIVCGEGANLTGFTIGNQQHLFCVGGKILNIDLYHVYYNNTTWLRENLSVKTGAGQMDLLGAAAFFGPAANQFEVYAPTQNGHVNQFTHSGRPATWTDYDLSAGIGAPGDGSRPGGIFANYSGGSYNLFYAPSTEVYELFFYNGSWYVVDITNGQGNADTNANLVGFVLPSSQDQFVYYMTKN